MYKYFEMIREKKLKLMITRDEISVSTDRTATFARFDSPVASVDKYTVHCHS